MSDNSVFQEVQAALLNSECDPHEAGKQGLCALYSFVATETEGSPLAIALERALADCRLTPPPLPGEEHSSPAAGLRSYLSSKPERKVRR